MEPFTASSARTNPVTVWLVEDVKEYRQTVQDLLNGHEDFVCPAAFETCEALFAALKTTDVPDVVLMDIGLPGGMSGIEGVKVLKRLSPATHIIMLTIHEDNDRIFRAICAGASGYLLKMDPLQHIFEAIEEVMRGGAAMNAQIAKRVLNLFTRHFQAVDEDYQLSSRERQILQALVSGKTKKDMAESLFLSFHTIDTHLRNIYAKLHVNSRSDAVAKAIREGLL